MNLRRRAFALSAAFIAGLIALGWWLRPHEAPSAPPQPVQALLPEQALAPTPAVEVASTETVATETPAPAFATFRGRVIDAVSREPVREFELTFLGTQQTKVGYEAPGARKFSSDDGRFEWEYLPPGAWNVTADAKGYQRFALEGLTLVKGEATPEVVLPLRRGHTVRGRIYDEATNAGIASASVTARDQNAAPYEGDWRTRPSTKSGKDGSFVLNGVPAGRTTLSAGASEYAERELNVVVDNDTASVEIGLSTGATIAGRLTAADGVTPVTGTAGLHQVDQSFAGGTARTGPAGEFSFRNLKPGTYRLTGRAPGGSATRDFVLDWNRASSSSRRTSRAMKCSASA